MTEKRLGNIYGRRLREARKSYGFSQTNLGIAVRLDESGAGSLISRYENGIHQAKPGTQRRFARALELPLTYFYTEDDEEAGRIMASCRSEGPVRKLLEIKSKTTKNKSRTAKKRKPKASP